MYPQHGQFSGEARNGTNNFRKTGAVYTNASRSLSRNTTQRTYRHTNGPESRILTGSFPTPRSSTVSRNLVCTNTGPSFEPVVNTARDLPVNTLKRRYEPEDAVDDIVPKRSKSTTISVDKTAVPQVIVRKSCTLELRGIPKWMNTIAQLDSHFSEYGKIMDIKVGYQADPRAATVTFSGRAEAIIAHRSTTFGFRNGSWSFKAANMSRNNPMEVFEMPPRDTTRIFIRKEENAGLQRRKQALLNECCEQLEALKAICAKCGLNDPGREAKLNMINRLTSSIENIQSSVSFGVISQEKQASNGTGIQELELSEIMRCFQRLII